MRNQNPKIVYVENWPGLRFKCKKCGQRWSANIDPGGRVSYGGWQCPNGCKPDK